MKKINEEEVVIYEANDPKFVENFSDPAYIYFIGMIVPPRPGVESFAFRLEHEHFPPQTQFNKEYHLGIVNWEEIFWLVIGIPYASDTIFLYTPNPILKVFVITYSIDCRDRMTVITPESFR